MNDNNTKKNDRIGMATSIGIHALLILLFLVIIAWQYPDPPPPSAPGAEIALGFEEEGKQVEEVIPEEVVPEVIEEEIKEVDNNTESPELVEEKKEEKKEVKVIEKPKEIVPKKENLFVRKSEGNTEKPGEQGDPRSLYNKNNGDGNSNTGNSTGTIGSETTMNIDGWKFDNLSEKVDPTSKIGFINFKFVIDEDGKIISISKIAGANLTPSEESFYKKQLLETTFVWKDDNTDPPARTTGYFSRTIRSK